MSPREPLPLHHSWPLWERGSRVDLGCLHDGLPSLRAPDAGDHPPSGAWRCDLATSGLSWSPDVYRLFGIPAGTAIAREDVLAIYAEESRVALERLRSHALRHRRGFTLDVLLHPAGRGARWVRINAAPRLEDGRAVELYGTKQDVTAEYR